MHLVLVSGPWGSGTSAVTGALKHLGIRTPKPYFVITDDPRTPITYENRQFRETVLEVAEEHTLRKKKSSSCIKDSLHRFRESIKTELNLTDESQILLKLPLSAIILDEISEVFQTRLIVCLRPIAEIERSRQRRKWPAHFGAIGARIIYAKLIEHIANKEDSEYAMIRYKELLGNPDKELQRLAKFLALSPSNDSFEKSLLSLRRP